MRGNNKITNETEFMVISKDKFDKTVLKNVKFSEIVKFYDQSSIGIKGLPGNVGDKGFRGITGQKGEKGVKGVKGLSGFRGNEGSVGSDGDFGEDGIVGEKGIVGESGQKGRKGDPGEKGQDGVNGIRGEKGSPGQKGNNGNIGDTGERGAKGERGDSGQNLKGRKGRKGVKGYGKQGLVGEKGETGEKGLKGVRGDKGFRGKVNNVITTSTDINGNSWTPMENNIISLNIKEEMTTEFSRTLIKIKKGRYYDRFVLSESSFCEIGTQLYDPLRTCYTTFSHLIYDENTGNELPIFIVTDEQQKVGIVDEERQLIYTNYLVCKIFFDTTEKNIPFSTWVTDKI